MEITMFCNKCGSPLSEGANFCRVCGQPNSASAAPPPPIPVGAPASEAPTADISVEAAQVTQHIPYQPAPEAPTGGKALGSLISGILGLTIFPIIASIVAIVLGHIGLSEIKKSAGRLKGEGMAIAGLVMGYLGLAMILLILIIAAIAIPNLLRSRIVANETSVIGAIHTLNMAEVTYFTDNPEKGYTCSLSTLGPKEVGPSDAAGLIDGSLASGTRSGYNISLRECESDISDGPVIRYKVVAVPINHGSTGNRSFCSDESGVVRFVRDASSDACLTNGVPIQ
jgi:type IV pilus assembly protein PilA